MSRASLFLSTVTLLFFAMLSCIAPQRANAQKLAQGRKAFPAYEKGTHGKGELKFENKIPIAVFRGTPKEISTQHAALLKKQIPHLITLPQKMAKELQAEKYWPLIVVAGSALRNNLEKSHRKEMREFVTQSGGNEGLILTSNFLVELRRMGGCSTFVVSKEKSATGQLIYGRNFDYPAFGILDISPLVMVFHPEKKHSFASIGYPGFMGVISGMNDAGLTVATLDVYQATDGSGAFNPQGTPMAFAFRSILENCATVKEAVKYMKSIKRTTWMNLTVCDEKTSVVLEISPKNVLVRQSTNGLLACTNHFRTKPLGKEYRDYRYNILTRKRRGNKKISVKDVARELHKVNQGSLTIQSMIFEPHSRKLHLAYGKGPCTGKKMTEIDLKPLFKKVAASPKK